MGNYPIFNNDYLFELPDVMRYLKCFRKHRLNLYFPIPTKTISFFNTEHLFADGLNIKLVWRMLESVEVNRKTDFSTLLNYARNRKIKATNFSFVSYSYNSKELDIPSDESRIFFIKKVIRERIKRPYNCEEYDYLEYKNSQPVFIYDALFDMLVEDARNLILFEEYYKEYREKKSEKKHRI